MNLGRTILTCLDKTGEWLVPQTVLLAEVNLHLPQDATQTELEAALAELEARREVVSVRNVDRGLRWKITDQGRARLAS